MIRQATYADAEALAELARDTFAEAFGFSMAASDLQAHLDRHLSVPQMAAALSADTVLVNEHEGRLIGFVQFGPAAEGEGGALHRLYVRREFQNRGLGSGLMEAAMSHPQLRAAERVVLDVWEHNHGARRLYERYGFEVVGSHRFEVASGADTTLDLEMERRARPFYPPDAAVPEERRTERVLLRPLRATDVDLDYEAVMASAGMLREWSQSAWPAEGFTLAENLKDLERHEAEHSARIAFTFTVMSPSEDRCLGCVYLQAPSPATLPACVGARWPVWAGFWVRQDAQGDGLEEHVLDALRSWLESEWAFDRRLFPTTGRQAELLEASGLREVDSIRRGEGNRWRVYAEVEPSG